MKFLIKILLIYTSILVGQSDEQIKKAKEIGIHDVQRKYNLNEIVSGDSIFSATGITDGDLVKGITLDEKHFYSETLISHRDSKTFEIIKMKEEII